MKKTFSINISGVVFQIDEDAYGKLQRYLDAIKSHFRSFEGRDEVMADIESRIAEILQKKINEARQVITIEDVDEVIAIMGQPADFVLEDEQGPGAGSQSYTYQPKRLYRDPEQRIIGGVCSGIASYFFIDPLWIRLIFIILAFSGFGFMLYLILWLVVPEARTTAEKLEMRGQQVNINNIEQSLKDEMNHMKEAFHDLKSKAKGSYRKGMDHFEQGPKERLSTATRTVIRIFAVIFGFFIFLVGLMLVISFLAILFKYPSLTMIHDGHIGPFPLYPAMDMIFITESDIRIFSTAFLLVIGIPLLLMLWAGIRLIFNLPRVRYLFRAAALIWIICLVISLAYGFRTVRSFRYPGEIVKEEVLSARAFDTLHIVTRYNLPEWMKPEIYGYYYFPEWRLAIADDKMNFYGIPRLRIYPSQDSISRLVTVSRARGLFRDDAEEIARQIEYYWKLSRDTLLFTDSFIIPPTEKWRHQEVDLKLYIPKGTIFDIDDNSERILSNQHYFSRHGRSGNYFIVGDNKIDRIISP